MNLQIYADKVIVEGVGNDTSVYLENIDTSDVLAQFSSKDKLDSIDKSDILDYLHQLKLEEE